MPRRQTPRLSEALSQYQTLRATHLARSTLINDQSVLRRFVQGVGDPRVHDLSAPAVEAWFVHQAERQIASSFNKVLQRVRGLLAFCRRRGWLESDPLGEIRPRAVPRTDRLQLSPQQLAQLVNLTGNPRDRGILAMAVNTGLRASDLVNLVVGNLDLGQGYVRVTIQKTRDVDRLPITADLDEELRRWLAWYSHRLQMRGKALTPDMRLFPSLGPCNSVRDGDARPLLYGDPRPFTPVNKPASVVQRALVRVGITDTKAQGFHTVRRSVGRALFELALSGGQDGALRTAAALLGHKSTTTTELYLGIHSDRLKRDDLLRGKSLLNPGSTDSSVVRLHPPRAIAPFPHQRSGPGRTDLDLLDEVGAPPAM